MANSTIHRQTTAFDTGEYSFFNRQADDDKFQNQRLIVEMVFHDNERCL